MGMQDIEPRGGEPPETGDGGNRNRDAEDHAAEEQRRQEFEAVKQRKERAKLPDPKTLKASSSDRLLGDYIQNVKELVGKIEVQGVTRDDLERLGEIEKSLRDAIKDGRVGINKNSRAVRDFLEQRRDEIARSIQAKADEEREKERGEQIEYQMPSMDKMLPEYKTVKDLLDSQIAGGGDASADLLEWLDKAKTAKEKILANDFQKDDYAILFQVTKAVEETYRRSSDADRRSMRTIIGEDRIDKYISKDEDIRYLSLVNRYFNKKLQDLTPEEQGAVLDDIDVKANIAKAAVSGGWRELELEMRMLKEQIGKKGAKAESGGLREWRGYKSFDAIEIAIRAEQVFKVPTDWENSPQTVSNIFRFIEDNELGSHEIGGYIQKALTVIEGIQDPSEKARDMREHLKRRLESFQAWHTMVITLRQKDMNPEPLISQFEIWNGRDEVTLEDFVDRFGEDSKGREFYVTRTKEGGPIPKKDKEGKEISGEYVDAEKVNLFDISFRLYNETLQWERIKMNMIEEMTRFGIDGSRSHMREIQDNVGYNDPNVSGEWKTQWDEEFAKLNKYFREAVLAKAGRNVNVDDVWARRDSSGTGIESFTKDLIQEWHRRRTLHGAFGTIGSDDLAELIQEDDLVKVLRNEYSRRNNKVMPAGEEELKKALLAEAKRTFEGRSFLEVRRMALQVKMMEELDVSKIKVDRDTGEVPKFDANGKEITHELVCVKFEELEDTGFFNSVDFNAYNFAWMMMWSNYDNIRVYSRDNIYAVENGGKLKDDFVDIVHHKNTNIFHGRAIDHTWEFYHDTIENRGRARDNDVNRIWKQSLPGKHHYIFPQNTLMVRWHQHFMTPEQIKERDRRVNILMRDYKFDNPLYHADFRNWMRSVAVMDMVENGQYNLAGKNFSELAKKKLIGKFEMIDLFTDRKMHLNYTGSKLFQSYLANPTAKKFMEINAKEGNFYSTRDARLYPWMTLAARSHWEVNHNNRKRLFNVPDITNLEMENLVDNLVPRYMEKAEGEDFKRQKLGMGPGILGMDFFRKARWFFWDERKKVRQAEGRFGWIFALLLALIWSPIKNIGKGSVDELKKQ